MPADLRTVATSAASVATEMVRMGGVLRSCAELQMQIPSWAAEIRGEVFVVKKLL